MKISEEKKEKIIEQILAYLFQKSPESIFTSHIAKEIARDEEFTKKILINLKKRKILIEIKKNKEGIDYIRRSRWRLSPQVYELYKKNQF
jgi:predicted transcriptional regulator with HTH domain